MTRTVEIAGAGLAGMAIAVRLAQHGWQVNLHEKSDDVRAFGAGIWLWENGLKSLEMMGVYDVATARARIIKEWRICDELGRTLVSRPSTDDRFMLPPRADLYQALIDQAENCGVTVHLRSTAVQAKPEGVLVLESGEERSADLIVAADGAYSRLRDLLMATSWVDYGIEAGIRTMIDYQPGDPEDVITEYINGSWRLLAALQPLHRRRELYLPERADQIGRGETGARGQSNVAGEISPCREPDRKAHRGRSLGPDHQRRHPALVGGQSRDPGRRRPCDAAQSRPGREHGIHQRHGARRMCDRGRLRCRTGASRLGA
jgi:2-polyprenyl-6-methoxyphenol hydroxylase-like FAD-dependent oxidoreductase